jgi:D-alanine transaminase
VVPVYKRQPYRLRPHLIRLQHSLDGIRLANPHREAEWAAIIHDLVAMQPFDDQGVYLQVTRGAAKRDHAFPPDAIPTVFLMSNPLPVLSREQIEGGVAVVTAADERWLRCDLKTISLLGNVLARQFAVDRGAVETVMFRDGHLTEASASNVLIVKGGTIFAPPKDNLILPGITYDAALELARQGGLPFAIRPVTKEEALSADEMWLSSSTKEVLAVSTLDGRPFASGKPGPVYRRMYALFQESKPKPRRAA